MFLLHVRDHSDLNPNPAEPGYAMLLHSVDPDQLGSEEAS